MLSYLEAAAVTEDLYGAEPNRAKGADANEDVPGYALVNGGHAKARGGVHEFPSQVEAVTCRFDALLHGV